KQAPVSSRSTSWDCAVPYRIARAGSIPSASCESNSGSLRLAEPVRAFDRSPPPGPNQPRARRVPRNQSDDCLVKENTMGLPRGYRTFADFERDAIRPNMRIGFSVDELEQPESEVEFDMDPFEAALWEAEQEELDDED